MTIEDPLTLFARWFEDARACPAITEPTAMALGTATAQGRPSVRIVLLKDVSAEGFVFYTNFNSRKGRELSENPHASLCFYWMALDRQVRVEGEVAQIEDAVADAYFASRPRARQIGAWASLQSEPLPDRDTLEARARELEARYEGKAIPRPPHWSGWQLTPMRLEFWQNNPARLHERHVYTRDGDGAWQHGLLYP